VIAAVLVATVLVVSAVVVSGIPAEAASTSTSSTTTVTTAAVPAKWDPRLKPIADKVARLRKLDFEHPVAAEFLGEAAFRKRVSIDRGKLSKQDQRSVERSAAQLRAVGLIGSDVDLVDAVSSAQSAGVLAYYDPKTQKITVKGKDLHDVSTRVTVAHELTHALQDQHFDLQKLDRQAAVAHGSTALQTLVEGDAVRTENAYERTLSPADQQAYDTENAAISAEAQAETTAKGVPDSLTVIFQAPYALGQSMLDAVLAQDGTAGVDALFRHPPRADAAFVTPSTLLEHRTFQTVKTPALETGEKRSGKPDVFGSLSLYQVLASRLDDATALSAADAWDGDSMITFTDQGKTCLRATFAGKGTKGISTITGALTQWAAQVPPGTATARRAGDRVTLTACDPGSATTAIPNSPIRSFLSLSNRDGLYAELVQQGLRSGEAACSADDLVRDPTFTPILDQSSSDPTAEPDPSAIDAVRTRLREIVAQCKVT
jgi:hypothetical protein